MKLSIFEKADERIVPGLLKKDHQARIFNSSINEGLVDCVTLLLRDIATPTVETRFPNVFHRFAQ